jgi:Flp pilus assembly protein protease CpaA
MVLGNIIGGFITILVGVNLIPTVADQIVAAQAGNVTGAASTILGLTTIFFALGIMGSGVALTVVTMRNAGVL